MAAFTRISKEQYFDTMELDSAGIIYPYVDTKKWNNVFRVETEIDSQVDSETLRNAVKDMHKRCPSFFVQLTKKNNRYMLYKSAVYDVVTEESDVLCKPFEIGEFKKPLIRVTYKDNRIGIELFHGIADGHSASIFMKTLTARYLILKGASIPCEGEILDCDDSPSENEVKDSFKEVYAEGGKNISRVSAPAYQYGGGRMKSMLNVSELVMNEATVHSAAKKRNVTVGMFLTASYIYALIRTKDNSEEGNITVSVPVDMRKMFPSETLRNFSQYALVSVKPKGKSLSFDDVLESVSEQFKSEITEEKLRNLVHTNVSSSDSAAFKMLPVPLKRFALKFGYTFLGELLYTSTLSSIGRISLSPELKKHVKNFRFILGEPKINCIHGTSSSYDGETRIMMSSKVITTEVQEMLCEVLSENGVGVQLNMRNPMTGRYDSFSNHSQRTDYYRNRFAACEVL